MRKGVPGGKSTLGTLAVVVLAVLIVGISNALADIATVVVMSALGWAGFQHYQKRIAEKDYRIAELKTALDVKQERLSVAEKSLEDLNIDLDDELRKKQDGFLKIPSLRKRG